MSDFKENFVYSATLLLSLLFTLMQTTLMAPETLSRYMLMFTGILST
jgi:hypothetical protein